MRRDFLKLCSLAGLGFACPGGFTSLLRAHPVLHRDGLFTIRAVDRPYDLHRPRPVTTLTIEHRDWPGNWFYLWLPETVFEEAHHPLIIAEAFGGKGAVGIGQRDYRLLFNNNDPILRCIHSEPKPIATLEPGARAVHEGLIVFDRGDHLGLVKQWERLASKRWGTAGEEARGPLRVHPTNLRYFTDGTKNPDGSVRAVYLTGSHTWNNLVDMGRDDPPKAFDFDAYLDFLERHGHNFIRLWAWDSTMWDTHSSLAWVEDGTIYHVAPQPWLRTDPGQALDGKPKFNLEQFDPAYFERLRARVQAAGGNQTFTPPFSGPAVLYLKVSL